ncbi:peptidyl-prolyl cis-trans isomerase nima-interacting 4-like protein [Trifolium pratense]|uniref:Peptidyl-prolyl cis-trans isomerase n=1 Tax=Trifolium pratense TaxID=57577 RepID=A0A2K3PE97_TRIPR|nr:peptidyl-prolyl cis-trans isomerase nima-interacting 4-like protein [Trifolium pratense]PNY13609.1 peptidyl-prolyl cis-trans isomerase nima-interacting 4-like protein [Trifolium pratense]
MKPTRSCRMVGLAMEIRSLQQSLRSYFIPLPSKMDSMQLILPAVVAQEYSECPSGKKGGDLGWFPRGKMAGPFQEVAFNTPVGVTSAPFKSTY